MTYRLVFVDEEEEHDVVFGSHNIRIFFDPKSLTWQEGTVIDFIQSSNENGFAFRTKTPASRMNAVAAEVSMCESLYSRRF